MSAEPVKCAVGELPRRDPPSLTAAMGPTTYEVRTRRRVGTKKEKYTAFRLYGSRMYMFFGYMDHFWMVPNRLLDNKAVIKFKFGALAKGTVLCVKQTKTTTNLHFIKNSET